MESQGSLRPQCRFEAHGDEVLGHSEPWSQVMFLRHCLMFDLVRINDVGFGESVEKVGLAGVWKN